MKEEKDEECIYFDRFSSVQGLQGKFSEYCYFFSFFIDGLGKKGAPSCVVASIPPGLDIGRRNFQAFYTILSKSSFFTTRPVACQDQGKRGASDSNYSVRVIRNRTTRSALPSEMQFFLLFPCIRGHNPDKPFRHLKASK